MGVMRNAFLNSIIYQILKSINPKDQKTDFLTTRMFFDHFSHILPLILTKNYAFQLE